MRTPARLTSNVTAPATRPGRGNGRPAPDLLVELPPHSDEAEAGILGCVLLDASLANQINLGWFYDLRNGAIGKMLRQMHAEDAPIDVVTVSERLRRDGQLEAVGGYEHLAKCEDSAPAAGNFFYWAEILRGLANRRELLRLATQAAELARAPDTDAGLLKTDFLTTARNLIERDAQNGTFTVRQPDDLLAMAFDETDNLLGDRLWATGQPLVIAGASSIGKSRLLLQLAVASISGKDFVGLVTRGQDRRWLILQAENSNRRLKQDLEVLRAWTGPGAWAAINDRLAIHTLETDSDGFLALDDPETVRRVADIIAKTEPANVAFDSLYCFTSGDLNLDQDMRAVLMAISRLVKSGNPGRSAVVLHHALTGRAGASKATGFERGSFGRNSKVLHAWARGQINVAPGAADSNDVLVLACGKCSNGREFPPFAVRLNPSTLIYEPEPGFDFDAWQTELSGGDRAPIITPKRVAELCRQPMSRPDLAKAIMEDCGTSRASSYRLIAQAQRRRTIKFSEHNERFTAR